MEKSTTDTIAHLQAELFELRQQLFEASETIEAIRTGQVDALVLEAGGGHEIYTLKTADQTYRFFIEQMTEGAITLDNEGHVLYCNLQFASMARLSISHIIGVLFSNLVVVNDDNTLIPNFFSNPEFKEEVFLRSGDELLPVLLSGGKVKEGNGEEKLNIIITDLSAQKESQRQLQNHIEALGKMNEDLEVSNHDLQQFASVASHDLQEPLRKIHIFSTLVLQKFESTLSTEGKLYLAKINDAAARMKALIIDILNYSKLSSPLLTFEKVNINDIINEILMDFELLIAEKVAKIKVGDIPAIHGNKGQIRQALQNIISNSLKFAQHNQAPIIEIRGHRISDLKWDGAIDKDGPYVLIIIKDEGIGFDEKYESKIFSLFERLHAKDKFEGTGIGLAISKRIIEKHLGSIIAKSSPGAGAEFSIILPVAT